MLLSSIHRLWSRFFAISLVTLWFIPALGFYDQISLGYRHGVRLTSSISEFSEENLLKFDIFRKHDKTRDFDYEFSSLILLDEFDFLVSVPEFYYDLFELPTEVVIGRRRLNWSPAEKFWSLGKSDGMRNFDLVDETTEGLTGVHISFPVRIHTVRLFGSYLYIPQLNPGSDIKNGNVVNKNEWSLVPPRQVIINNNTIPVTYNLNRPNVDDVIFNGSGGIQIETDWGPLTTFIFGLYKPEALLRIGVISQIDATNNILNIDSTPFVNNHFVGGIYLKSKESPIDLGIGFLVDKPERKNFAPIQYEGLVVEPNFEKQRYFIFDSGTTLAGHKIELHYIYLFERPTEINQLSIEIPRWMNAFGIRFVSPVLGKFRLEAKAQVDITTEDKVLLINANYHYEENLRFQLGIELIDGPSESSFWSSFRSNDTVWLKADYKL